MRVHWPGLRAPVHVVHWAPLQRREPRQLRRCHGSQTFPGTGRRRGKWGCHGKGSDRADVRAQYRWLCAVRTTKSGRSPEPPFAPSEAATCRISGRHVRAPPLRGSPGGGMPLLVRLGEPGAFGFAKHAGCDRRCHCAQLNRECNWRASPDCGPLALTGVPGLSPRSTGGKRLANGAIAPARDAQVLRGDASAKQQLFRPCALMVRHPPVLAHPGP